MKKVLELSRCTTAVVFFAPPRAQESIKIGLLSTGSDPEGVTARYRRDGAVLARDHEPSGLTENIELQTHYLGA